MRYYTPESNSQSILLQTQLGSTHERPKIMMPYNDAQGLYLYKISQFTGDSRLALMSQKESIRGDRWGQPSSLSRPLESVDMW